MRKFLKIMTTIAAIVSTTPLIAQTSPVVVELYTSQGCSSCPPADALLIDLAKRDDVIALALHVDYWDYIGWADSFASPAFTRRQHGYAQAAHAKTVYTPQMVIGGRSHVIGSKPMDVMDQIQAAKNSASPVVLQLSRDGDRLTINASNSGAANGSYVVQVVRYTPLQTVDIRRGENAGRSIAYANIVTSWASVGRWDARAPLSMQTEVSGRDPVVVIVQQDRHGPILAAAELR